MIIDAHIHTGYLNLQYVFDTSLEKLLETMDSLKIDKAINCNMIFLNLSDIERGMRQAKDEYAVSDGRISSFLYFDPNIGSACLECFDKHYDPEIFRGIKIHPSWCGVSADDESYRMIWEYARKMRMPILAHSWDKSQTNPIQIYSHPSRYERYISEFNDVKFVFAHSGGRYDAIKYAASLAKKHENIYFDIAGDIFLNGFIEYLVKEAGSERVIYGSDYNMIDQRLMLGAVLGADINYECKENILSKTADKVYFQVRN